MKKKKEILLIGPYSVVGGVSMHIKRLSNLLEEQYSFQFIDESPTNNSISEIYNIRNKNFITYYKLLKSSDIVHIHTGIWWLRCIHIFFAFLLRKKTIVTVHSLSNLKNKFSILTTRIFLLLAKKTITVSEEVSKAIKPRKEYLLPAFIPPIIENEDKLPKEVLEIIEKDIDSKIITSNAFKLVTHLGEDLYGLDIMIEVAKKIKNQKKRYKIIFVVASVSKDDVLFEKYSNEIRVCNLEEIIYIIPYSISFVNLMIKSDIVIRATNTDGDALTVREALYLSRPIIASDVSKRPEGTILFKNRDSNDLFLKIQMDLERTNIEIGDSRKNIKTNRNYYQNYFSSIYNFE